MKSIKKTEKIVLSPVVKSRLREAGWILIGILSVFLFLSLISYHQTDKAWSSTGDLNAIQNIGGRVGAWLADLILYLLGYAAYFIPVVVIYTLWMVFKPGQEEKKAGYVIQGIGFSLVFFSLLGLLGIYSPDASSHLPYRAGGLLGDFIAKLSLRYLEQLSATFILMGFLLIGITLSTGFSWFTLCRQAGSWLKAHRPSFSRKKTPVAVLKTPPPVIEFEKPDPLLVESTPVVRQPNPPVAEKEKPSKVFENPEFGGLPPLSLLEKPSEKDRVRIPKELLSKLSVLVEEKLAEFSIQAQVVAVYPGPVITRFELSLAAGTKASKLTSLSRDLARALSVVSVRIVEVIPGKSYVGLEIPNEKREIVRLSEILSSEIYQSAASALSLAIGKDIRGDPVVVDLAKMPHLLVAGTTGSGKSVGLNAMLLSILYKSTPDTVRLIMVDPKMLELSIYDGIPHLLTPVITDMKEAANALRWCIQEMDRRYRLMSKLGVRNLAGYNTKVSVSLAAKTPLLDPFWPKENASPAPELELLPNIVVLVDEFADLMMVVGKKIEELITRLAQKARAAGIHLILATQRPSVDVITGLIKANVPARIAFQTSSRIDSRTILDQQGAEQLLGHGDMLYLSGGTLPFRVHGAFVADQEVHDVVHFLKEQGEPNYLSEITAGEEEGDEAGEFETRGSSEELDPLFDEAVAIIAKTRRASISNVQRRLKIGYNRAARILEQMEAQGMVSAMETNGSREVLLPPTTED